MEENLVNTDDPYGEKYLAHYGIPGMKWGTKRGVLTSRTARSSGTRIGKVYTKKKKTSNKKADAKRAAFKKAAAPKIKNALISLSGTSVGGKHKKIGGVSQESMRAKGKDNIKGYLELIGKQAVVGVGIVGVAALLDGAY